MALNKPKILAAAQKHLSRGSVDRALKELARIVREDPKDLRVRQKVAELLARQGKTADAMKEFHVVAEAYERGGFFPKAAAIYKQMLRSEPGEMRWHMALGEIYLQLALLSDAADHFNTVATHYDGNGSPKERIEIYSRLVALNADSLEYADRLSDLYQKESDPQAAFDVWARVAGTLEARGDMDALIPVYERMSALREDDLDLIRTLANIYLDRNDPRRALAKLQQCFQADPQDTETLNLLADAFVDLGENVKAVAVLRELAAIYESLGYAEYRDQVRDRIADLEPAGDGPGYSGDASLVVEGLHDPVANIQLQQEGADEEVVQRPLIAAETYLAYGFPDKAREPLELAVARFPASFALHRALVPLRLYFDEVGAALTHLEAMYEIAMDHSDYGVARACLETAVQLAPDDPASRARLNAFEEALGEFGTSSQLRTPVVDAEESMDDFGEAIALSQRIAGVSEPDPMADEDRAFGDFEFDDSEIKALAAQLSAELDDDDDDDDDFGLDLDDDDPLAGLDLEGFDDFEEPARSSFEEGSMAFESGNYEAARGHLERAIDEAGEDLVPALELLGVTARRLRDFRSAVESFRRLLAERLVSGEDQLRILFEIGVTYEAAGNRRSAYKVYTRIVGANPDFRGGEVQNRLSSLELELGMG